MNLRKLRFVVLFLALLSASVFSIYFLTKHFLKPEIKNQPAVISIVEGYKDKHIRFIIEIYDEIDKNYWDKINQEQLSELFRLAAEKVAGAPQKMEEKNSKGVAKLVGQMIENKSEEEKVKLIVNLSDVVLANLQPFGRSRLMSRKQTSQLTNLVSNVDPETDLYKILGVSRDTLPKEIETAYKIKLKENLSEEEKGKVERAYEALLNKENRQIYDSSGAEPTVIGKLLNPSVAYIEIKRFSPSSLQEFEKAANSIKDRDGLNSLILDLRGNIGGAVDLMPYFLGPFIGPEQYAYEFYKKGEKIPFKTKTGWLESLIKYKKVVVLIDSQTQSSGEIMAATLKKYNVGVTIGTPTKGWGTIEQITKLDNQISSDEEYHILLVQSITLRDDGQPIEGRGVEPNINIKKEGWDKELNDYFNFTPLVSEVKKLIGSF